MQRFLLGTNYQRIYGIDIYNSKNRHITIGTNKEKKFSLDIYKISSQNPLEELLDQFREGQFSTTLTSKQKLSLLKILRRNRPAFAIGKEPFGKIRGHDIELYLNVGRPYPPMLRRPPYPESLETRKEIKGTPINLKISVKKGNFGQQELLALGHKVSGLILAIDQNKVAAVGQKPVPKKHQVDAIFPWVC
ncbi:hypothetical protein O181_026955 [Austropuccinia psidii MF-1]|uniref:Uncharacterized protein n=1 Tax=Austropuccinia psidii MF-1 TaxID=1389203 RepID=A0A9Q3H2P9_9BASI|nr:hypothetical protein [Austropuccinia psidii MF-1]